jgi:hypothetical protein
VLWESLWAIKAKLQQRRHWSIGSVGRWLARVMQGWLTCYAVPGNMVRLQQFRDEVAKMWLCVLRSRSQRHRWNWSRMHRLTRHHLPEPRILHGYPTDNFRARFNAGAV